ncbi:unnamed protein product, partial [Pneumocystis jirovecii]
FSFSLTTFSPSGKLVQIEYALAAVNQGVTSIGIKDKARKVAHTNYKLIYNEYPPTRILVQEVAKIMQEATQSGGIRPFGVSILVAGWDEHNGPSLYQIDPSGTYFSWKATAIGKFATSAKTFLEKRYNDQLELEDAIHIALLTLKEGFEGELSENTIEIGIVGLSMTDDFEAEDADKPYFQFRKLKK